MTAGPDHDRCNDHEMRHAEHDPAAQAHRFDQGIDIRASIMTDIDADMWQCQKGLKSQPSFQRRMRRIGDADQLGGLNNLTMQSFRQVGKDADAQIGRARQQMLYALARSGCQYVNVYSRGMRSPPFARTCGRNVCRSR